VNGILFNHESPLRGLEFVTRKITNSLARIKLGYQDTISLGNTNAYRDWGYAPEYVEAMWLMLQQNSPDDFVIATGEKHSVAEFLNLGCRLLGIETENVVEVDERFIRPLDVNCLIGDSSKAAQVLGWQPATQFERLVEIMIEADLKRWKDHKEGIIFPWDALNNPQCY